MDGRPVSGASEVVLDRSSGAEVGDEVSLGDELRELPDGTTAKVTVMYAGLGQAWYVSKNGKVAGLGTAGSWIKFS